MPCQLALSKCICSIHTCYVLTSSPIPSSPCNHIANLHNVCFYIARVLTHTYIFVYVFTTVCHASSPVSRAILPLSLTLYYDMQGDTEIEPQQGVWLQHVRGVSEYLGGSTQGPAASSSSPPSSSSSCSSSSASSSRPKLVDAHGVFALWSHS